MADVECPICRAINRIEDSNIRETGPGSIVIIANINCKSCGNNLKDKEAKKK